MPIRVEVPVGKEICGRMLYLTKKEWEELDRDLVNIHTWNKGVTKWFSTFTENIKVLYPDNSISVQLTTLDNSSENFGFEAIEPRNYLSQEKVVITMSGDKKKFYFGHYDTTLDMGETIKKYINERLGLN